MILKCIETLKQNAESRPYVLPDGAVLDCGQERMLAPELLFDPSLIGRRPSPLDTRLDPRPRSSSPNHVRLRALQLRFWGFGV